MDGPGRDRFFWDGGLGVWVRSSVTCLTGKASGSRHRAEASSGSVGTLLYGGSRLV